MSNHYQPARELTITTTGNIDDLDIRGVGLLRMNNASDSTIRGLKAGFPGQRLSIVSLGAGHVYLAHQNASSLAANRLLNFATSANTPLAAGVGACVYQYDGTTARWRLVNHDQGAFISVTYNSGDFTSTAGTWTVDALDIITHAYYLRGRTLTIAFNVFPTTISAGAGIFLIIPIPGGFTISAISFFALDYFGTDPRGIGSMQIHTDGHVYFSKSDALAWSAGVNNTAIRGTGTGAVT